MAFVATENEVKDVKSAKKKDEQAEEKVALSNVDVNGNILKEILDSENIGQGEGDAKKDEDGKGKENKENKEKKDEAKENTDKKDEAKENKDKKDEDKKKEDKKDEENKKEGKENEPENESGGQQDVIENIDLPDKGENDITTNDDSVIQDIDTSAAENQLLDQPENIIEEIDTSADENQLLDDQPENIIEDIDIAPNNDEALYQDNDQLGYVIQDIEPSSNMLSNDQGTLLGELSIQLFLPYLYKFSRRDTKMREILYDNYVQQGGARK